VISCLQQRLEKFFPEHDIIHYGGGSFAIVKDYPGKKGEVCVAISPEFTAVYLSNGMLLTHKEYTEKLLTDESKNGEPLEGVQRNIIEDNAGDIVVNEYAFQVFTACKVGRIFFDFVKLRHIYESPPGLQQGSTVKAVVKGVDPVWGVIEKISAHGLTLLYASKNREELFLKWSEIYYLKNLMEGQ